MDRFTKIILFLGDAVSDTNYHQIFKKKLCAEIKYFSFLSIFHDSTRLLLPNRFLSNESDKRAFNQSNRGDT